MGGTTYSTPDESIITPGQHSLHPALVPWPLHHSLRPIACKERRPSRSCPLLISQRDFSHGRVAPCSRILPVLASSLSSLSSTFMAAEGQQSNVHSDSESRAEGW